ncbi:MAG: S-methyl-5-thioribose-1-phosphate isomerase [Magnetococcales bacterium]|nr:S-methyl-5-thioribose-1-phosphate isomerase [Magnetococcales bacterium]
MEPLAPVRWHNNRLGLIDQRLLPIEERLMACSSAEETAQAIETMVVRGAPAIGCAAAFGLAVEAMRLAADQQLGWIERLQPGYARLRSCRPTAVNLAWALDHLWSLLPGMAPHEVPQQLLMAAQQILADDLASCRAMGQLGADQITQPSGRPLRILTHCNAGALATAGYGTALGVVRALRDQGRPIRVMATETRPLLQGARLTAWELVRDGIDTTLITDSMAGHFMSSGEVDVVIVGADRVAANGDVANKIGTYALAVLARHHAIPFMVVCPLSTIDRATAHGDAIPIEERAAVEVTHWAGLRRAAEGVQVRNPAFDVTPATLVSMLVTEKQVIFTPNEATIAALWTT